MKLSTGRDGAIDDDLGARSHRSMDEDIYSRLATLLWLLSPTDVAELVRVANDALT